MEGNKVHSAGALVGGEWTASRPDRFTSGGRAPNTHWKGGWEDLKVGLDAVEERKFLTLPVLELRPLLSSSPQVRIAVG
jgi:hypothetical protein